MKPQVELKLKPKEERRIQCGHFWIFSNELEKVDTTIPAGTPVLVRMSSGEPLGVGMFNPHSLIAVRILEKGVTELPSDFVYKRLRDAFEYRRNLGLNKHARVCFGEADLMPGLVVDRYGDALVVEILSAGMEAMKADIEAALKKIFSPSGIYYKNESEFRHLEGLPQVSETTGEVPEFGLAEDGDAQFKFPLRAGQKTGYYYDQRDNREFLKPYVRDRVILDLYSYVGGFAITAALAGAEQVWGIDSSQIAVDCATENAALNKVEKLVTFHKDDAERALSALRAGELPHTPDMVILDPPNFVKSRKNLAMAVKHYVKLNEMALRGLQSGGYLATSTCSHHVSREIFMEIVAEAARRSGKNVVLVELRGQAKDHPVLLGMPETEYLHFALLQVK